MRVCLVVVLTLYLLGLLEARSLGRSRDARRKEALRLFRTWADGICRMLGIEKVVSGPLPPAGCCVVPNHQSYLDILLLGSITPLVFVAKAEIASWPGIGFLARTADQVFIERSRTRRMLQSMGQLKERLDAGCRVCIFLEGTTSGGDRVHRFHPPLLQPVLDAAAPIVPAAIRWSSRDPGILVSEDIAYWKDHNFALHLWRLLGLRGIRAEVVFGQPRETGGRSRVDLAEELQAEVQSMFEETASS